LCCLTPSLIVASRNGLRPIAAQVASCKLEPAASSAYCQHPKHIRDTFEVHRCPRRPSTRLPRSCRCALGGGVLSVNRRTAAGMSTTGTTTGPSSNAHRARTHMRPLQHTQRSRDTAGASDLHQNSASVGLTCIRSTQRSRLRQTKAHPIYTKSSPPPEVTSLRRSNVRPTRPTYSAVRIPFAALPTGYRHAQSWATRFRIVPFTSLRFRGTQNARCRATDARPVGGDNS